MSRPSLTPSPSHQAAAAELAYLLAIMSRLRDPSGGCPWDLKQTIQTLSPLLVEECYEVVDGVEQGPGELCEELGDLLSVMTLYSQIASENGSFTFLDVVKGITEKLIRRHPHVFGEVVAKDSDEVLKNWEAIKKRERTSNEEAKKGLLDTVPKSMPALQRAHRIGEKTTRVGFDWKAPSEVAEKVREEVEEFLEATALNASNPANTESKDLSAIQDEFGDLLFSLVQLSRHLGFNAEEALNQANNKFTRRFKTMEKLASEEIPSGSLENLSSSDLETLWQRAKGIA